MKKATTKKMDFEYRCFPCLKQDDKARSYTRSYDLVLHMVNTHRKFPVDAKHNTYYAADGSDLREATKEEIEKYRLAASHKRKKPDADPAWGKGGGAAAPSRGDKRVQERPHQREENQSFGESSRDREKNRGSRNREADVKDHRESSRDARGGKDTSSTERRKTDAKRDVGKRESNASSSERRKTDGRTNEETKAKETPSIERGRTDTRKGEGSKEKSGQVEEQKRKKRQEEAGLNEMDEDERDRRNLEDIQQRMEACKVAKDLESARTAQVEAAKSFPDPHATTGVVMTIGASIEKNVAEKTIANRRTRTKIGRVADEPASADVGQREAARQWAEEDTSNEPSLTQSSDGKGSTRSRTAPQKMSDKQIDALIEDQGNLYAQEYIVLQYSAAKEGVSSTERLGMSFVSGAMGRQTDDPKMFETSVELIDCGALFRTTKEKAQVEVSNPPPNSIDSEV